MRNPKITLTATNKSKKAFNELKLDLRGLAGIATKASGLIGVAFASLSLKNVLFETIDFSDQLQKLEIRLGASTEALSEYKHVADLSGIEFNKLTVGWQRMTRRIAEAAVGKGEAKDALKELRLEAVELNKLAPEDQFEVIADAIAGLSNQSDKVRLGMKLFDSEGVSLIQTMSNGAEGIREMREEARLLGLTISQETADEMANLKDQITYMNAALEGGKRQIISDYMPAIRGLAKFVYRLSKEFSDLADVTASWAAQLAMLLSGEFAAMKAIGEFRKENRLALEKEIEAFNRRIDGVKKNVKEEKKLTDEIVKRSGLSISGNDKGLKKQFEASEKAALSYFNSTRSPMEEYEATIREINQLRIDGFFDDVGGEDTMVRSINQAKEALDSFNEKNKETANEFDTVWSTALDRFAAGVGDSVADAIIEQKNFRDVMQEMARGVVKQVISGLVEIGVKKLALFALEKAGIATSTAANVVAGTTTAAAWAPAAAAVSLASFGANAVPAAAGMTSTYALGSTLSLMGVAHDGLSSVPTDGTYLLQKGEKIVNNRDTKKLDNLMNGGGTTYHAEITFNVNAIDARTGADFIMQNSGPIETVISRAFNNAARRGF